MSRAQSLLSLLAVCGEVVGRKKLQKIVHILKESSHPFEYRYGFHFHGPFSAELKGEIDLLVAEDMVRENEGVAGSGLYLQYSYCVSARGKEFLNQHPAAEVSRWSDLATHLNKKSAQELEAISTIIFLLGHGTSEADVKERFISLKPQLLSLFDSAFAEAGQLRTKR